MVRVEVRWSFRRRYRGGVVNWECISNRNVIRTETDIAISISVFFRVSWGICTLTLVRVAYNPQRLRAIERVALTNSSATAAS